MTLSGAHERARRAWRTAIELDDLYASEQRERRLIAKNTVVGRRARARTPALYLALGAAFGVLVGTTWFGRAPAPLAPVAQTAPSPPRLGAAAVGAPPPAGAPAPAGGEGAARRRARTRG